MVWSSPVSQDLLLSLLGAAVKGSLIFGVVYVTTRLLRGSHPSLRHLLWFGAISSYLLILMLTLVIPPLLPVRPVASAAREATPGSLSALLRSAGGLHVFRLQEAKGAVPGGGWVTVPFWSFSLLLIWVAGAAANLAPITVGSLRVRQLVAEMRKGTKRHSDLQGLVTELGAKSGLVRPVMVVQSAGCRVPFAAGILRPVLVLPSGASAWPARRLRAVVLHELSHVRRGDCLSQPAARLLCALFWFVPLVWIAFWFLQAEQEKACDAEVLGSGVSRRVYAACLLQIAHHGPGFASFAGLYSSRRRKRMLEDRIKHIVNMSLAPSRRWPARAASVLALSALVLAGGARWKELLSEEQAYQRFVGRWVNEAYSNRFAGYFPQSEILVIGPEHKVKGLPWANSKTTSFLWAIRLKKTWNDARGNTYCRFFWEYKDFWSSGKDWRSGVGLMRVDRSGEVWEANLRLGPENSHYPDEINPGESSCWTRYLVYRRR